MPDPTTTMCPLRKRVVYENRYPGNSDPMVTVRTTDEFMPCLGESCMWFRKSDITVGKYAGHGRCAVEAGGSSLAEGIAVDVAER